MIPLSRLHTVISSPSSSQRKHQSNLKAALCSLQTEEENQNCLSSNSSQTREENQNCLSSNSSQTREENQNCLSSNSSQTREENQNCLSSNSSQTREENQNCLSSNSSQTREENQNCLSSNSSSYNNYQLFRLQIAKITSSKEAASRRNLKIPFSLLNNTDEL